jgi:serine/threonine protein kinase
MPLEPGARLGPYEIVALQGAGGMGEVYRARDTRLNRTVALKIVSPAWANTEEGRQRFEREARVVSQIDHPNICALYDVGRTGDHEFLVMEFVEGETLERRLERGPLAAHDVISLGVAIASGLDAAHRQGVVHRDLNPGNIILSKTGIKILDFGLARSLSVEHNDGAATRSFSTSVTGTVLGTLPYMAPEQLQGGRGDARADVFALGAVLPKACGGASTNSVAYCQCGQRRSRLKATGTRRATPSWPATLPRFVDRFWMRRVERYRMGCQVLSGS